MLCVCLLGFQVICLRGLATFAMPRRFCTCSFVKVEELVLRALTFKYLLFWQRKHTQKKKRRKGKKKRKVVPPGSQQAAMAGAKERVLLANFLRDRN